MPTFTLTSEGLRKVFQAWSVPFPASGLVLFGLRGALPRSAPAGWVPSVDLETATVDHLHLRCTLGIADPKGGRLFAAAASTVPHKDNVDKAKAKGGVGANQVEPGFYLDLTKGEHLQGKLNGHQALRQTANRFYRRGPKGLPYTLKSPLYFGNPYDNLHCAWNLDGRAPGFSSAGCMVVAGIPHAPRHESPQPNQGPWKVFHDLLYAARQKSFPILILPGDEAAAALAEAAPGPIPAGARPAGSRKAVRPRLVFGSEGEAVRALQRKLAAAGHYKGRADGDLGPRTYRAWNASGFMGI